jgi:ketosteroid isomerase-like protein
MSDSVGGSPQRSELPAHAQLLAITEDWAAAIVSNDAARIASFMADEWVIVSEWGVSSKEQFLSAVESGDLTHSAMDRVSEARIRTYGDTAVLTARITNTAHHQDQRFDADEWTTDVFVKREGRWLCVLSHITAAAVT